MIGFFFTPPLFLATKVAISFVYYSPKTTKCTQKPKIEKKFTGIDQSSERASEYHSPHHIYNSLLRMRAIHELINVAVHILLIRWQRIQVLCESRCVRYIHLQYWRQLFAIERNGSYGNSALRLKKLFSVKIPIWDLHEADDYKLTRFPFDGLDDDSLCLCNLWRKEQLGVKLLDDFSAKNHQALCWFFRQKLGLSFLRESLYSNETLEHWARGTFAALSAQE